MSLHRGEDDGGSEVWRARAFRSAAQRHIWHRANPIDLAEEEACLAFPTGERGTPLDRQRGSSGIRELHQQSFTWKVCHCFLSSLSCHLHILSCHLLLVYCETTACFCPTWKLNRISRNLAAKVMKSSSDGLYEASSVLLRRRSYARFPSIA